MTHIHLLLIPVAAHRAAEYAHDHHHHNPNCEPIPAELKHQASVVLTHLRKTFGEVVAIDDLTCNFYRGQV